MAHLQIERRRSPRREASGTVEVSFASPSGTVVVTAQLLDTSATGFRIAHQAQDLEPGLEFRLKQAGEAVRAARVIWTQILNGDCVSGCYFTGD